MGRAGLYLACSPVQPPDSCKGGREREGRREGTQPWPCTLLLYTALFVTYPPTLLLLLPPPHLPTHGCLGLVSPAWQAAYTSNEGLLFPVADTEGGQKNIAMCVSCQPLLSFCSSSNWSSARSVCVGVCVAAI